MNAVLSRFFSSGLRISAASIAYVFQNPRLLAKLGLVWSILVAIAVAVMCVFVGFSEHQDFATVMARMQDGDLERQYFSLTSFTSIFGQLAVAIGWSRLVLLGESPRLTLRMPNGSARYFSRSLILLLALLPLALPGLIVGAIAGSFIPGDVGKIIAGAIMILAGLAAAYLCLRAWLIFPAVAIGDDTMSFRRSFALTRGAAPAIMIGTLVAYIPFLLIAMAIELAAQVFEDGVPYVSAMIIAEFLETLVLFGAVAAAAGVMAQIYRAVLPDALPNAEQTAVFE